MTYHAGGGLGCLYLYLYCICIAGNSCRVFPRQLRGSVFSRCFIQFVTLRELAAHYPPFFPRLRADFSPATALSFFPRAKFSMLPGFVPPEREQDRMGRKQKNIGRVCMRAGVENDHGSGRNVSNWGQRKWSCDGGALFLPHNFMAP